MSVCGGGWGVKVDGKVCEAYLQGQGQVGQGVDREVFPNWGRGDVWPPAEGEVDRGEAYHKVPGRILGPEGRVGGDGLREPG